MALVGQEVAPGGDEVLRIEYGQRRGRYRTGGRTGGWAAHLALRCRLGPVEEEVAYAWGLGECRG
jgi:hypothetical protein